MFHDMKPIIMAITTMKLAEKVIKSFGNIFMSIVIIDKLSLLNHEFIFSSYLLHYLDE